MKKSEFAPRLFKLAEVPEFQRFAQVNPGKTLDATQATLMYSRAIHWMSFLDVLWPNFEDKNWFSIDVAYIVVNDPDDKNMPGEFYTHVAGFIAMFWRLQLEALYPNGDWSVDIDDEPEMTVRAEIKRRE